ncbi:MAG: hypothetical protein AB8D78_06400 [Akkermansiaceae bacterium]
MSATLQRDQAMSLAKTPPAKAHKKALQVSEPWFRAQALSAVAYHAEGDPLPFAAQASKAAAECNDDYKRSAVRAWEISALAERDFMSDARRALDQAVKLARTVQPFSSRSEALYLLLQAAFAIGNKEASVVNDAIKASCPSDEHWRCKRALRDGDKLISGELVPRKFHW